MVPGCSLGNCQWFVESLLVLYRRRPRRLRSAAIANRSPKACSALEPTSTALSATPADRLHIGLKIALALAVSIDVTPPPTDTVSPARSSVRSRSTNASAVDRAMSNCRRTAAPSGSSVHSLLPSHISLNTVCVVNLVNANPRATEYSILLLLAS